MGVVTQRVVLCALILLQLLCAGQCYLGRKVVKELPQRRDLSDVPATGTTNATNTNVLRSHLIHRDNLGIETNTSKSLSERFFGAIRRGHSRIHHISQMQKRNVHKKEDKRADKKAEAASSLESQVSVGGGEYVMQFSLGTPPQKFSTIVDTGSDLCWVQCLPCEECIEQQDALFNPAVSSTYAQAQCEQSTSNANSLCEYEYMYGDGSSTSGEIAFETITLDSSVPHFAFGCGHNQEGDFAGADGLIGLGQGALSLPSQLSPPIAQIFSYCLVGLPSTTSTTTSTSSINFGDAPENSAAKYTPLIQNTYNPTFYYVGVEGISVGTQRLQIPASSFEIDSSGGGGVILDSGTTLTYWNIDAFTAILQALQEQITYPEADSFSYGLDLCYDISGAFNNGGVFQELPKMVVHFTNVDFEIPVPNMYVAVDETSQTVCLAMAAADEFSIIGNIQQQNNLVVHDVVNQRVGFLAAQCDKL